MSVRVMAAAMSFLWRVLRLFSSEWFQDLCVSSRINISQACKAQPLERVGHGIWWCEVQELPLCQPSCAVLTLAKRTGASALIMRTSSSDFMICKQAPSVI